VPPPAPTPPALSAPGLIGPISITDQPISGPRSNRRSRNRPYSHARYEIDLGGEPTQSKDPTTVEKIETALAGKETVEGWNLLRLAAGALHAMSARRFRWIEEWTIHPGGALAQPEGKADEDSEQPVGDLLKALEAGAGTSESKARSFAVKLTDRRGNRAELVLRRVHRGREHALRLDLWGLWTKETLNDVIGSLASRLPVTRSTLTKYQYATG
jgi:hypothetical protein